MDKNFYSLSNIAHGLSGDVKMDCDPFQILELKRLEERRICLFGVIADSTSLDCCDNCFENSIMTSAEVVQFIMQCNKDDMGIDTKERKPIIIYINSPGGDINEGFPVIAAIELSKTPVHTVNVGQWSSMAFLIGIAGHKRFALPYTTFLMHDGSDFMYGSGNKVQDEAKFSERYKDEIIEKHILRYSNMSEENYTQLKRVEYYMLPEDALKHGFIDQIVEDIDVIL